MKKQRGELTSSTTSTSTTIVDKLNNVNDVDANTSASQLKDSSNAIEILAKTVASQQKSSYTFDLDVKAVASQQKDIDAADVDAKLAAAGQLKLKQDQRTVTAVKKTKIFKPDSKHNGWNFLIVPFPASFWIFFMRL